MGELSVIFGELLIGTNWIFLFSSILMELLSMMLVSWCKKNKKKLFANFIYSISACYHLKPFVCEDSDELLNFVRSRNPGLRL